MNIYKNQSRKKLIFNYDVANRSKGILLVDLGQITPRSEAAGLNPITTSSISELTHMAQNIMRI
jgi:hypothetical protein